MIYLFRSWHSKSIFFPFAGGYYYPLFIEKVLILSVFSHWVLTKRRKTNVPNFWDRFGSSKYLDILFAYLGEEMRPSSFPAKIIFLPLSKDFLQFLSYY